MVLSVPTRYPVEQSANGVERDTNGRLFTLRPPEQYKFFLERLGLSHIVSFDSDDELGREDITWRTLIFSRNLGTELKSVETIESVLWDDRKLNTYKFVLIRALCHLATHRHKIARWHRTHGVHPYRPVLALLYLQGRG